MNLKMANKTTVQIRNIKVKNGLPLPIMNEVFQVNEFPYNFRNPRTLDECSIFVKRQDQNYEITQPLASFSS